LRGRLNQIFVKHPWFGQFGYNFIRVTKIDRSTRGTKRFLKKLQMRGFQPRSILDVGANYGAWSHNASAVFPDAVLFLIEPQVEMRPFLDKFCLKHPGSAFFLAGAGAEEGELKLTVWDDLAGSSFMNTETNNSSNQRMVPIVSIDSLVSKGQMPVPDLVKIDVQGFELEVLQGSNACFDHTEVFIIEVSFLPSQPMRPIFHDILNFMATHHYVMYDIADLKYRPFDGALGQADVCFVKKDGIFTQQKRWY
jgi:FkbM family methyltransferase